MSRPRYVAIANPDGLRWRAYAAELLAFWRQRDAEPEVEVIPWDEVTARDGCLDGLTAFDRPAVVRLESPGRDWAVTRQLLAAGARAWPEESADWLALPPRKGWQVRPGLLYAGFCRVLHGLRRSFDARPQLTPTACPLAVAELFDKRATSARLAAAGVPVPPSLDPPATPAELIEAVRARRFAPAYVKLNTGSSASAIAVLHTHPEPRAVATLTCIGDEYYSTRKLARHAGVSLQALLAFLLREGACVQRGLRMTQVDGQNCDVRVVVVRGEPAFTVFRVAPGPMTNLHLGGRRGDPARCRAALTPRAWLDGLDACVAAAALYRSAMVGVDLLFEAGSLRPFVLEVNAFGDFFPNLTDDRGRSVHRFEIESTARACGLIV